MNIDLKLYKAIKDSGINLILSVPCIMLKVLLEIIEEKKEIQHIHITREEEGVGVAAGAYLGGRTPVILMQNSGLGNSINAISSLLKLYIIPVVFIMSHRGGEGEKIAAQRPMGSLTPKLLNIMDLNTNTIDSVEKIEDIKRIVEESNTTKTSAAILLKRSLWEV